MEILSLVKMTRGMRKTPKEEYDKWKDEMTQKNTMKRKLLVADRPQEINQHETKDENSKKINPDEVAQSENELDFWLKGHMTGEKREREGDDEKFDEKTAVK